MIHFNVLISISRNEGDRHHHEQSQKHDEDVEIVSEVVSFLLFNVFRFIRVAAMDFPGDAEISKR